MFRILIGDTVILTILGVGAYYCLQWLSAKADANSEHNEEVKPNDTMKGKKTDVT